MEGRDVADFVQFRVITNGSESMNGIVLQITDVVFAPEKKFYTRHRTYVMWDDSIDRVWVYSDDTGLRFYERNEQAVWESYVCVPEADMVTEPPLFIKEKVDFDFVQSCWYELGE
jgi:hypothetical protein